MKSYSRSHLSDPVLLRNLAAQVARESTGTADLLADLAEVDARKLYLPAACASMFDYCVRVLRLSEDSALKRIQAARAARCVPAVFPALADGRVHLSAVVLLAPHLTQQTRRSSWRRPPTRPRPRSQLWLANRFPRPDVPTRVLAAESSTHATLATSEHAPGHVEALVPGPVEAPTPRTKVTPLSPQRFALQVTMSQDTHDKLRYAQALLSHQIPSGDVAQVLDRALDALIRQLEKRKFAATAKPRRARQRVAANGRYIPAHVKNAVWERDRGQCTFVSATGQRCAARRTLEFDHVDPVARGGQATVARIRLRCRAHNQYEAERTFGSEFMRRKRQAAQRRAAERRTQAAAAEQAKADVISCLRTLGFRADEARRAAALCETIPNASLEGAGETCVVLFPSEEIEASGRRRSWEYGTTSIRLGQQLCEEVGGRQRELRSAHWRAPAPAAESTLARRRSAIASMNP